MHILTFIIRVIKTIPESILKKRKAVEQLAEKRAAERKAYLEKKSKLKEIAFKHAESYVNEYLQKEKSEVQAKRAAKSQKKYYVPEEPKLVFVVRIKG